MAFPQRAKIQDLYIKWRNALKKKRKEKSPSSAFASRERKKSKYRMYSIEQA